MPGRKLLTPSTKQRDTRPIYRKQYKYDAGVYNDIPGSAVLDNAVALLQNWINFGNRLIGRGGCKRISNTLPPTIDDRGPYSATKSGSTVTLSSGDITSADIGLYVWWSDTRTYERITAVTSTTVFTVNVSTSHSAVTDMTLTGALNGNYYHKPKGKALTLIHNKLYVSDYDMSSYTECVRSGINAPSYFKSVMDEFQNFVFLFNRQNIFKIDLSHNPPVYYPVNASIPTVKITNSGSKADATPYGYRYLYTMVRLSGTGNTRDRNTDGVNIELESGSTKYSKTAHDYGEIWQANEVGSGYEISVGTLTVPRDPVSNVPDCHWNRIGLYRTLDIGDNGEDPVTGVGNNTELYIWVADIPIAKAFTASQSGTTVTATVGEFTAGDVGATIIFEDGTSDTITAYTSSTVVTVSTSRTVSSQAAAIGGGVIATMSQTGTTVTAASSSRDFTASDIGKTIFFAEGLEAIITDFTSSTVVTVDRSQSISSQGATYEPVSRVYDDGLSDDDLRAQSGAWTLFSRFYEEIPKSNTGLLVPGWMFAAPRNGNFFYYCELPDTFEYLVGYYYPKSQFGHVKDRIIRFAEYPDQLVIECRNSMVGVPLNNFSTEEIESIGVSISTLAGQETLDHNLGIAGPGAIRPYSYGKEIGISSDFGLRIFDGHQWSENLIHNRIMKRMLKLQPAFEACYDEENGFTWFGREP